MKTASAAKELDDVLARDGHPAILTTEDVAKIIQRVPRTVKREVARGLLHALPKRQQNERLRFSRIEVARYLAGEVSA